MQAANDTATAHLSLKRRRAGKACDHCRRLKIKCDNLTPCTHCVTYERACTYNVPYRRARTLAGRARDLEDRLQTVERLLKAAHQSSDLDDRRLEPTHGIPRIIEEPGSSIGRHKNPAVKGCGFPIKQTPGSTSSPASENKRKFQQKPALKSVIPLPPKDVAHGFLALALQDACVLHRFVHEPLFYSMVDYIYETPTETSTRAHLNKLALFYAALSLGVFFADGSQKDLSHSTVDRNDGGTYFDCAVNFLDLDECRCLVSLQALCFLVIFLQSSGQLDRCYSYVGIALRSAVALGLHHSSINVVNPVEHEIGRRVFWVIWRMDVYSSSMLGISSILSTDLIDQGFPEPFEGMWGNSTCFASEHERLLVASANAHTRLTLIMPKVTRLVIKLKSNMRSSPTNLRNLLGQVRRVEVEQELQKWYQHLMAELLPGCERTLQLERAYQLLRIAHAYVQMVLYEPLAQFVSKQRGSFIDSQMSDYLMKHTSATRRIVSTGVSIHKSRVANSSSRSTMISTNYSAILSLIAFLLNSPASSGTKGTIFKETLEGRRFLEELSPRSKLANGYVQKLNMILERFQDRPRPFPISDPILPVAGANIEARTANSAPFSAIDGSIVEGLTFQPNIPALEHYGTILPAMPTPGNLVFESHFHLPQGNVFGNFNDATSAFQPEFMDANLTISPFDLLDATDSMELDHSLLGGQNTEPYSLPVGGISNTLELPPQFTSDVLVPDFLSSNPSIPGQETILSRPMPIGQQEWTEPIGQVGWLLSDMNDAEWLSETVEPTLEQMLGSITAEEMD